MRSFSCRNIRNMCCWHKNGLRLAFAYQIHEFIPHSIVRIPFFKNNTCLKFSRVNYIVALRFFFLLFSLGPKHLWTCTHSGSVLPNAHKRLFRSHCGVVHIQSINLIQHSMMVIHPSWLSSMSLDSFHNELDLENWSPPFRCKRSSSAHPFLTKSVRLDVGIATTTHSLPGPRITAQYIQNLS